MSWLSPGESRASPAFLSPLSAGLTPPLAAGQRWSLEVSLLSRLRGLQINMMSVLAFYSVWTTYTTFLSLSLSLPASSLCLLSVVCSAELLGIYSLSSALTQSELLYLLP